MVIDLKYHLTTIIAIFLALGIGILVGSAMIGDDGIVREQQKLIVQIEDDLQGLRNQNNQFKSKVTSLEAMIGEQEQFIDLLFQDAISGQLAGLDGLMVQDSKTGANSQLVEALKLAGMDLTEITSLPSDWSKSDQLLDGEIDSGKEAELDWDLCFVLTQSMPPELTQIFSKEQILRPINKQMANKQGLYELITSLRNKISSKMAPVNEKREVWHDLNTDTGVQ